MTFFILRELDYGFSHQELSTVPITGIFLTLDRAQSAARALKKENSVWSDYGWWSISQTSFDLKNLHVEKEVYFRYFDSREWMSTKMINS